MRYRIYCETDGWQIITGTSPPTECPINGGHTVRADSVSIIQGTKNVSGEQLDALDGTVGIPDTNNRFVTDSDSRLVGGAGSSLIQVIGDEGLAGNQTGYIAAWGAYATRTLAEVYIEKAGNIKGFNFYVSTNNQNGITSLYILKNGTKVNASNIDVSSSVTGRYDIDFTEPVSIGDVITVTIVLGPGSGFFLKGGHIALEA